MYPFGITKQEPTITNTLLELVLHERVVGATLGSSAWSRVPQELKVRDHDVVVDKLLQLSKTLAHEGSYVNARIAMGIAAGFKPKNAKHIAELAARLYIYNEGALLHALVKRVGSIKTMPVPLLLSLSNQLSMLNRQSEAMELLDEAIRADPDYPPTLLACGRVLMFMGRVVEARLSFEHCIKKAPNIALAHWSLSNLLRAESSNNRIDVLHSALSDRNGTEGQKAMLAFALQKELDDLERHAEAAAVLQKACRLKRETVSYDANAFCTLAELLISTSSTDSLNSRQECNGPTPIFIIGMHRSGTTLLEQMLDGHPSVHGAGELYDFTSAMRYATDHHCQGVIDKTIVERASVAGFDFGEVGRRYLAGVKWRLEGKPFFTDKLPSNFLNAGFICQALPQAKLLHMVRDPIEVCFSNLRELFSNANPYSYDQIELADFYLQYHRLMAHWREVYPGRILDIRYDRMVRDPEAVIREVCDFCALEFTPEMLAIGNRKRGVATASAVQVREGIQVRDVPKWKPYEAYLQPMITRLREGGVLN